MLFVMVVFSVIGSAQYTSIGRLVWIAIVLFPPILGSLIWFVWGRTAAMEPPLGTGLGRVVSRQVH